MSLFNLSVGLCQNQMDYGRQQCNPLVVPRTMTVLNAESYCDKLVQTLLLGM